MNTNQLIEKYIAENSKLDKQRAYVGMSSIGDCPRAIYQSYTRGINIDYKAHQNSFRGYRIEAIAKEILIGAGIMKAGSERELIASFDERFKGHTDGESIDGMLIEIKSKRKDKFDFVLGTQRLPVREFKQVQCYMAHGGYSKALVFCICPETFDTTTITVSAFPPIQSDLEIKAKEILKAIDEQQKPRVCECGRCK